MTLSVLFLVSQVLAFVLGWLLCLTMHPARMFIRIRSFLRFRRRKRQTIPIDNYSRRTHNLRRRTGIPFAIHTKED